MILYIGNKLTKHGLTPTGVDTLGKQLAQRYEVKTVSSKKTKWLRLLDALSKIVRYRSKLDLVIIDIYSTSNFYYGFLSGICTWSIRKPFITVLRGGNLKLRLENNPVLTDFLFTKCVTSVAPSQHIYEIFQSKNYKVKLIPNNIELANYDFKIRKNVKPRLLWVRSFHKIYNPTMAIKLLELLRNQGIDACLCMVGPDKDGSMEVVKNIVKEIRLESHIKITGKVTKKEWISLSKDYDIFINTTDVDNLPVSVIEAMALGMLVISTNVGGIPNLINHNKNGFLVHKDDAVAMLGYIETLVEDVQFASQISLDARKTAEAFNWHRLKHAWFSTIDPFIEDKQRLK